MPQTIERPTCATPSYTPESESPVAAPDDAADYVPFGNMESRNGLQERLEIPLLLRALRLPCGGRVLEVGCGRGVALPVLAERLRPEELVGIDVDRSLIGSSASIA